MVGSPTAISASKSTADFLNKGMCHLLAILHAYSEDNIGDGLLVELVSKRLSRVLPRDAETSIVALDGDSFGNYGRVLSTGLIGRRGLSETLRAMSSSLRISLGAVSASPRIGGKLNRELADASAFVAVGGGYLRAGTRREKLATAVNHLPQLLIASKSDAPSIYLPQSIGPLRGLAGRVIQRALARVDTVIVRDDVSLSELSFLGDRVVRIPDLAVLDLADNWRGAHPASESVMLVGRRLPALAETDYEQRLRALPGEIGGDVVWAVQAAGSTDKSDAGFYRDLGVPPAGPTDELVASLHPAAVVSVRLHGTLVALMNGSPSIHIAYERKGFSAMSDMGLSEWTHKASDFSVAKIADQVAELRRDPSRYWGQLERSLPGLRAESHQLDELLSRIIR